MVESAFARASFSSSNGAGDRARVAGVSSLESTATLGDSCKGDVAQVTTLESMVDQVMMARGAVVVLVPVAEGFDL
jgi:hypothetical protein